MMTSEKVILGLSGGVDSAVACSLLQNGGYEVSGLFLDCGKPGDREAAETAAAALNIPLTVRDIGAELERLVCAPFAESYLHGETPNPCVMCNRLVKLRALTEAADENGARYIATGHYAVSRGGGIFMGRPENDQSYMLSRISPEQAARLLLPLGAYRKTEVRELARELRLPPADRADSMEICFIPEGDYGAWLAKRGETPKPGNFIYKGEVIGRHRGVHCYTLGQRRHFGVYVGKRVYVSEIRWDANEVVLADDDTVYRDEIALRDMRWLVVPEVGSFTAAVRARHTRNAPTPCTVTLKGDGALLRVDSPVRAPARGQIAALYRGEQVLGSGVII